MGKINGKGKEYQYDESHTGEYLNLIAYYEGNFIDGKIHNPYCQVNLGYYSTACFTFAH